MYRAVITGIGLLTPTGNSPDLFFPNLLNGRSGIARVQKFCTADLPVRIGGELQLASVDIPSNLRDVPSVAQWSVMAARKALQDAKLNLANGDPFAVDVVLGSSTSSFEEFLTNSAVSMAEPRTVNSETPARLSPALAAVQISRDLKLFGEAINISSACSSTTSAIGHAFRLIRSGQSKCVVTGGADEGVSRIFFQAYGRALSQRALDPARACRPFDRTRDGAVFSDAACVLIVEEYQQAQRRGARIYCEISGFGATSEAPCGVRLNCSEELSAVSVERALRHAQVDRDQVEYYCALGIAHPFLDIRETRMLKRVFREHSRRLSISSIKSMLGHPLGAAGALQVATSALAIKTKSIPPTINYFEKDPECDLDYVPNEARQLCVRNALVYTLGCGGANAALVLSAC